MGVRCGIDLGSASLSPVDLATGAWTFVGTFVGTFGTSTPTAMASVP